MQIINEYMPWKETGQTPNAWMLEHAEKYVISKERILASAVDVKSGLDGIPGDCAVYFLIEDGEIVYVGKANCLRHRINNHVMSSYRKNGRGIIKFRLSWLTGMPELFVEDIENYYIHWLQPSGNVKYDKPSDITKKLLSRFI